MENKIDRNDLIYRRGNKEKDKTYDFQKFKTIRSFGRKIYNNYLPLHDAFEQKIRLKEDIDIFKESIKPKESVKKTKTKKKKNDQFLRIQLYFLVKSKKFLMALKVECSPHKTRVIQMKPLTISSLKC